MTAVDLNHVGFSYDGGSTWAVDDVSVSIADGERVCLVGPNGSGKSTLARVIAGLHAPDTGTVTLLGEHVFDTDSGAHPEAYRTVRRSIGAVFQNPEDQIVTTVVDDDVAFGPENLGINRDDIGHRITNSLAAVDMTVFRDADPTVMSGGQQQRIAIAGMLAMAPSMIVLDEPTAMLDTAMRAEVMRILDDLQQRGVTIVHVTHHREETVHADRVICMNNGRIVSDIAGGNAIDLPDSAAFAVEADASNPLLSTDDSTSAIDVSTSVNSTSTRSTTASTTHAGNASTINNQQPNRSEPIITVDHLTFAYPDAEPIVSDLSFSIARGETVAIMGHNGAGKSTVARLLCALEKPHSGSITVAGIPLDKPTRQQRRELRQRVGYVMQHPERQLFADTVAQDVAYGPTNQKLSNSEIDERVNESLSLLHINHLANRSPFALSGGQQRLAAIAGVIACHPDVLVMDEPTASLDAHATAIIHNFIRTLHTMGVTVVIITHSQAEAQALADRVITLDQTQPSNNHTHCTETQQPLHQRSPLKTVDPRVKMATFLVLMFTAFAISNIAQLTLAVLLTVAIVAVGRLNPLRLLASVRMILGMLIVMGLLNIVFASSGDTLATIGPFSITTGGLTTAALYMLRFTLVIVLGAVIMNTTTPTALTDAVGSLLSPLQRCGVHTQEIALVLSLALRFLPTLARETHAVIDAQSARGGDIETGSPGKRIRALAAIVVPVFAGTLRHADNLALALDARCYEQGVHRTHWRIMRVRTRDVALMATAAVYLILLFVLR